ncbi:MAG TPA: hypothetical protein VG265_15220 [Gaiellaceae bacterium]|nr:hypothetical protein [Gaiellaceae bacterium]
MGASEHRDRAGIGEALTALDRAYTTVVDEARAQVAAGREPPLDDLEKRLRAATKHELSTRRVARGPEIEKSEGEALKKLAAVATVFRARRLLTREPDQGRAPAAPARPVLSSRSLLRSRPTITGNMDVRRGADADRLTLSWDPVPAVVEWEVRFSQRPDPRASYVVLDTSTLAPGETAIEVPIGEHLFRVNILGRSRDGRPLRRALISGLTREGWNDRWERRASAA